MKKYAYDILAFLAFLFFASVLLLVSFTRAFGAPSYATLTGTVLRGDGTACGGCNVAIRVPYAQPIGGTTIAAGIALNFNLDANGAVPANKQVAQELIVEITVDKTQVALTTIPASSSVNLYTLISPPVSLPTSTSLNSLSGVLGLEKGGTNASTWTAGRCVQVNSGGTALESASAACGSGGGSSNSFETWTTSSGTSPVADSATDTMTFTGTAPIVATGNSAGDSITLSCTAASGSVAGCLSSADWTTFNGKQDGPLSGDVVTSGAAATIQANSVALTTDTTGNYAAGDAEAGNATGLACTTCVDATDIATGAVTSAKILDGEIVNADVNASAAILFSKLATTNTDKLLGRDTAAGGAVEEIGLDSTLEFTGTSSIRRAALTGDVTASAGSNATTVAADAVALGTDTTGNYVATITGGTGIASSGATTGEGIAHSLSFDATELGDLTFGAGVPATMTWTYSLSGANDPVIVFANGAVTSQAASFQIGDGTTNGTVALVGGVTGTDPEVDFTTGLVDCTNCRFTIESAAIPDITGTPSSGEVPYWSDSNTLTREAAFTYNAGTDTLTAVNFSGTASTANDLTNTGIDTVLPDIDGTGLSINTASTPDELQVDMTELVGNRSFSDGSSDTGISWTWNLSVGTDPVMTFGNNSITLNGVTLGGANTSGGAFTMTSTSNSTKGYFQVGTDWKLYDDIPDADDSTTYSGMAWTPSFAIKGTAGAPSYSFALDSNPTVALDDAAGAIVGLFGAVRGRGTYTRSGAGIYLPSHYLFFAAPNMTSATDNLTPPGTTTLFDGTTITYTPSSGSSTTTGASYSTIAAAPNIKTNGGGSIRLDWSTMTGFSWAPTLTETTGTLNVATITGFKTTDVQFTGSPAVTTQVAVDIGAMANATTNIGIRNADTTVFTPAVSTITATTDTVSQGQTYTTLNNTSGSSKTLASAPTISNGQDGQILILTNTSAQNVLLQDQGTLASSNLRLSATSITLGPRDSVVLMYSSTVGDWIQITAVLDVL